MEEVAAPRGQPVHNTHASYLLTRSDNVPAWTPLRGRCEPRNYGGPGGISRQHS